MTIAKRSKSSIKRIGLLVVFRRRLWGTLRVGRPRKTGEARGTKQHSLKTVSSLYLATASGQAALLAPIAMYYISFAPTSVDVIGDGYAFSIKGGRQMKREKKLM